MRARPSVATQTPGGWSRTLYAPAKIAAVVGAAAEAGVAPERVLSGTGLHPCDLVDPDTLTSTAQLYAAVRQAALLCNAPDLGVRIGSRMRISSYGLYGYALLCAASLRETLDLATRYHLLANPLVPIRYGETGDHFVWFFPSPAEMGLPDLDARIYRVLVEMQMGIYMRLGRDVMGPDCTPTLARLAWRASDATDGQAYACQVHFEASTPELYFPRRWLDTAPQLANTWTAAQASRECAKLVASFEQQASAVAQRVYSELMRTPGQFPSIEAIAGQLHMTSRTLRRHLQAEGTSYAELLTSVRRALAEDYLRSTRMSIEDIAAALDFSDARSFRHAFVRWTGQPPRDFRRAVLQ